MKQFLIATRHPPQRSLCLSQQLSGLREACVGTRLSFGYIRRNEPKRVTDRQSHKRNGRYMSGEKRSLFQTGRNHSRRVVLGRSQGSGISGYRATSASQSLRPKLSQQAQCLFCILSRAQSYYLQKPLSFCVKIQWLKVGLIPLQKSEIQNSSNPIVVQYC